MPQRSTKRTWRKLYDDFGPELTAKLVGLNKEDVEQYIKGKTKASSIIDDRLYFLVEIHRCLSGSYNETGMRGWFSRRRILLENRTPLEILSKNWRPLAELPQRVLKLAIEVKAG